MYALKSVTYDRYKELFLSVYLDAAKKVIRNKQTPFNYAVIFPQLNQIQLALQYKGTHNESQYANANYNINLKNAN